MVRGLIQGQGDHWRAGGGAGARSAAHQSPSRAALCRCDRPAARGSGGGGLESPDRGRPAGSGRRSQGRRRGRSGGRGGGRVLVRLVLRQLGRRLGVAVRSQGDARRSRGLRRDVFVAGHLHRVVRRARHHARGLRAAACPRRGDVQSRGAGPQRRRRIHRDREAAVKFRRRRIALYVALALGALGLGLGVWIAWPLPRGFTDRPPALSLALQDRHGLLLRTTRAADGSLAGWVPLGDMDPQLLQAFIALEDRRFYQHHGGDVRAVARALVADLRSGHVVSGGSTITMQLARLLRPAGRTWLGKLYQAAWALRLERHVGKQEILEQYLNRVPLGQGSTGVSAAASLYFAASASHLSLGQAALVAGLASAPSADNPFVAPERARARRTRALARMGALGFVTREAIAQAEGEPLVVRRPRAPVLAPHFTSRLLAWADDSGSVMAGTWRTSLDLPLQTELEAEVRHTVALLGDQGVRQGAAVVLDNRSGEILAWVGSPDFWADTAGQVDMVVSPRQPGSALKPFLYGFAFGRGITAASVLADVPRTYQTSLGPYQPRNYDRRFHGPVRAREALASSFNVPAVSLTDQLGVAVLLRTLHQAGFTTLDHSAEFYGLGLALGNGDVTLLELANAYRALANDGERRPYRWRALPLAYGRGAPSPNGRVVSPGSAALLLHILSDPPAPIPGLRVETPFA